MMKTISQQLIYEIYILYTIVIYLFTLRDIPLYNNYTDEYRACILTSLGEFRYKWYESVYVTLLTV